MVDVRVYSRYDAACAALEADYENERRHLESRWESYRQSSSSSSSSAAGPAEVYAPPPPAEVPMAAPVTTPSAPVAAPMYVAREDDYGPT